MFVYGVVWTGEVWEVGHVGEDWAYPRLLVLSVECPDLIGVEWFRAPGPRVPREYLEGGAPKKLGPVESLVYGTGY